MKKDLYLGIDTSNYTSSAALVREDGEILCDLRKRLSVAPGEKGLRQSEALFQHWGNMPGLIEKAVKGREDRIAKICVSTKPRPSAGSYMPVFRAGLNSAQILATALEVPLFECSHQEGHIMAALLGNHHDFSKPLLCAHISGGTLEIVLIKDRKFTVVGGTKDISYGKLLDRIGVDMGFAFPAGAEIDRLAFENKAPSGKNPLGEIFTEEAYTNVSGIEFQLKQLISFLSKEDLSYYAMERVSQSFVRIAEAAIKETGAEDFLVFGGIAESKFLRRYCEGKGYTFGRAGLCGDNAVGVASLKGKMLWED